MQHPGTINSIKELESPTLVFFADRIRANTDRVLKIAGSPERLWPHIKTHKTLELVTDLIDRGVVRFKCATIAEAELLARAGAAEVLIAYPMVGPNIERFAELCATFDNTRFSVLVESEDAVSGLASALGARDSQGGVFIDLDMGMGRTGIAPDDKATDVVSSLMKYPALKFLGLHAYDGHNRQTDPDERRAACKKCLDTVRALKGRIEEAGVAVTYMIFGGTPTFPCYAQYPDAELSPGTAFLFDWGYGKAFPDLPFEPAAFVLGRVISRNPGISFTLDIGSKAIAADPAGQRGMILEMPEAVPVAQSEEHWVFQLPADADPHPGDPVLVVPAHVCPTVNLYEHALVVDDRGAVADSWSIVARTRKITI